MPRIVLGLITAGIVTIAAATATANAQYYNRGYYHGNNNGWVAPFVGGAIIGGIVGQALLAPPPPTIYVAPQPAPVCWQELVYYDAWSRPVYRTVCR